MIVLGLTGSIGMGKSVAARQLRALGVPVFDADAVVHQLLAPKGRAVPLLVAAFPGVVAGPAIDRSRLATIVYSDVSALQRLEAILHPLVRLAEQRFLRAQRRQRRRLVALEIPLLFETNGQSRVDVVAVVSAPEFLQTQRVLRRAGMTPDRLTAILHRQLDDGVKRRRADVVVPSGLGRAVSLRHWKKLIARLSSPSRPSLKALT